MKKIARFTGLMGLALVLVAGVVTVFKSDASAADIPVTTTIQAAINSAADGDRVVIPAGTYNESFNVYNKTNLTIVGQGTVVINAQPDHPAPGDPQKAVNIVNSTNVTLRNVTVDGSGTSMSSPDWATGIDATGTPGLMLDNVTVRNFGKNAIAVTAKSTASAAESGSPSALVTKGVTLITLR